MFAKIMFSVVGFYILHERQSSGLKRFDGRSYTERLSQGSVRAAEIFSHGIYLSTALKHVG